MKWLPKILVIFLIVPLSFTTTGCQRTENPLGRKTTHLFPPSYLQKQAASAYAGEKKKNPQSENAQQQALVQRVGQRLIVIAKRDYPRHCQDFNWEVNLFEKPKIVNAYCMPGGKIAFYTGIMPICKNEAGVAAVMGHEISHALLRHGSERVTRSLGVNALVIGAALGVGSSKMQDKNKKKMMAAIGLGSQVGLILPFSRKHESESDRMGLELMAKAGYDPSEAPEIWVRMSKKSGGQAPPEFLSTHPSNQTRIAELTALQPGAQAHYRRAPTKYGKGQTMRF
ncbi:MAG: M48 family metallopeptidase [Planctomycetota bacterium]|nr:M48 family metallopeptidase [Planctomycetota bacterium]